MPRLIANICSKLRRCAPTCVAWFRSRVEMGLTTSAVISKTTIAMLFCASAIEKLNTGGAKQ